MIKALIRVFLIFQAGRSKWTRGMFGLIRGGTVEQLGFFTSLLNLHVTGLIIQQWITVFI
ncbi:hypothetical protein DAI18_00530 [Microvirgula aerodenitrificans]|uniref:Uncharacterized protein n=1 Tax=Microvirgula aerodenitrificans TaxID=57480 RepID=A0A2U3TH24_9NEIS|nr:hypothetical protein DAI18_00530 [Microvirgula aerodenitrificans]